jgi:outer membrane immunogenic protein
MKTLFAGSVAIVAALACAPASAEVFDGPYLGGQAGWNHDKIGRADTDIGTVEIRDSRDSFVGGVFAGYNHKVAPKVVLGVEGGFAVGADDAVRRGPSSIDPSYTFDLSARAGYLVTDQTLLYVRGGYENSRAKIRTSGIDGTIRDRDNFDGWSVGGGVERSLTDKVSARLEYRYADLGGSGETFDRHKVLVGVAYNF